MFDTRWYAIYKLENVKMFINRALSVDDKYIRIASGEAQAEDYEVYELDNETDENDFDDDPGFAEYERAVDIVLFYQEIVARGALNEINLIVENELKIIASYSRHKRTGKPLDKCWIKERKVACKEIENSYNIKFKDLPGYLEVDKVREIINAYKHDEGYSGEYEPFAGKYAEVQKQYKLNTDEIIEYVDSAKKFLGAIPGERLRSGEDFPRRLKINTNFGSKNELE